MKFLFWIIVAFGVALTSCKKSSEDSPEEKFSLTSENELRLHATDEFTVMTCEPPEYGRFLSIQYSFEGQWQIDYSRHGISESYGDGGGYFLNDKFVEFHFIGEGCDTVYNQNFPAELTIPYHKDFMFIRLVGDGEAPPLPSTFEQWTREEGYNICSIDKQSDCYDSSGLESTYEYLKALHETNTRVPVYKTEQGERSLVKVEYDYNSRGAPENKHVEYELNLDDLPVR